jgi:hypothetical protein
MSVGGITYTFVCHVEYAGELITLAYLIRSLDQHLTGSQMTSAANKIMQPDMSDLLGSCYTS